MSRTDEAPEGRIIERVPVGPPSVLIQRDAEATMRDGTILRADVYRPEGPESLPVILMRLPYGKAKAQSQAYAHPLWYAEQGYIVVVQDVRGRGRSDGVFYPFLNEMDDGYDTIEWAGSMEGSNGRVGMYGFSYPGATQLLAALSRPPHLTCLAPGMTASQFYDGWTYRGGALSLAFVVSWALSLASDDAVKRGDLERAVALKEGRANPARYYQNLHPSEIPLLDEEACIYFQDWLRHPTYDDYWKRWSVDEAYERITVPTLNFGGWYDSFKDGTIRNFAGLRDENQLDEGQNRLVMGPWYHMPWMSSLGGEEFGLDGVSEIDQLQLQWFDKWLKGKIVDDPGSSPVHAFVMGRNTWQDFADWPPPGVSQTEMYLDGAGRANSADGGGELSLELPAIEAHDIYAYDPWSPVQSAGGHSCCVPALAPMGPKDQRSVELQTQVLVYDSASLDTEIVVSGKVVACLWVASSAVDTDFVVKLVDVRPTGKAINICEGILRMCFRDGMEDPHPMEPWEVYEIEVDLGHTCIAFQRGHRIRVEIASSCFPQWDRNLNTGFEGEGVATATQLVFRGGTRASRVTLPTLQSQKDDYQVAGGNHTT